jgi:hypothetical protein
MHLNRKEMKSMALFQGTFVPLAERQKPEKARKSTGKPGRGDAFVNWLFGRKNRAPRQGRSALEKSDSAPVHPDFLWHFQYPPH